MQQYIISFLRKYEWKTSCVDEMDYWETDTHGIAFLKSCIPIKCKFMIKNGTRILFSAAGNVKQKAKLYCSAITVIFHVIKIESLSFFQNLDDN